MLLPEITNVAATKGLPLLFLPKSTVFASKSTEIARNN